MILMTILAVISLTAAGETLGRPPMLTFDSHVDYTAYYRKMVERPGEPNALGEYIKLLDEAGEPRIREPDFESQLGVDFTNISRGGPIWFPDEHPKLDEYLRKHQHLIEIFERGCSVEHYWRPLRPGAKYVHEDTEVAYTACRRICKVLLIQGWRATDDQFGELCRAWNLLFRYTVQLRGSASFLEDLVARSVDQMMVDSVLVAIARGVVQEQKACQELLRLMIPRIPTAIDVEKPLMLEWAAALDHLQYMCHGGVPDKARWESDNRGFGGLLWKMPPGFDAREEARRLDELYQRLNDDSHRPYFSPERTKARNDSDVVEYYRKKTLSDRLHSTTTHYLTLRDVSIARGRGVLLALAIHAHREASGTWPRRLRDLKNIDAAYRIDPFSGKEFIYELRDGEPFLYSIGTDCKDDNGTPDMLWAGSANEGDWVFWPVTQPYQFKVKKSESKD